MPPTSSCLETIKVNDSPVFVISYKYLLLSCSIFKDSVFS